MDHVSSSLASTARANSTTTNKCCVCKLGPSGLVRPLISCATCHKHWHSYCHNPPISLSSRTNHAHLTPHRSWHCVRCSKKMIFDYEVECAGPHCTKKIPAEGVDSTVYCFLCKKRKAHEETKRVIPKPETYAFPAFSRAISPRMKREGSSKRGYSSPSNTALEAKRPRLMRDLPQASPTRIPFEARSLVTSDEIHSRKAFGGPSKQPYSIPKHRATFTASSNELSTLDAHGVSVPIPLGTRNTKEHLENTPKLPAKSENPGSTSDEDKYTVNQLHILNEDDNTHQWNVNISSQDIGKGRVASSDVLGFDTCVKGSIDDRADTVNDVSSIRNKEQMQHMQAFNDTVPEILKEQSIVPEIRTINNILPDTILNNFQSRPPDSPPQDIPAGVLEVSKMRSHGSNGPSQRKSGPEERFRGYSANVAGSSSFILNEGIRRLSISSEIMEEDEVPDAEREVPQDATNVSESAKSKSNMVDSSTQTDIEFSIDSHVNHLPYLVDKEPEGLETLMENNQGVFNDFISTTSSRSAALDAFLYNQSPLNPSSIQFFHIDPRKCKRHINRTPATHHESETLSRSRLKDYLGERLTSPDIEAKEKRGWSRHQEINILSIPPLESRALLQDFGLPENLEPILRDGELVMSEVIPSRRKSRNAARRIWRIPK